MVRFSCNNDDDIEVFGGGGITETFTPGTSTETIAAWVRENVPPRA